MNVAVSDKTLYTQTGYRSHGPGDRSFMYAFMYTSSILLIWHGDYKMPVTLDASEEGTLIPVSYWGSDISMTSWRI